MSKVADWFDRATRGSECGDRARNFAWSLTPLGDPETWPSALRAAVQMCFSTRFPVLVTWGRELTMIYNDAYRTVLGSDLHPQALGAPVRIAWNDVSDVTGQKFQKVLDTGTPSWDVDLPLRVYRSGFTEDTRFTFSLSPLRDDDGLICGVLDISWETTDVVVDRRRLRTLRRLSTALANVGDDTESLPRVTARVLNESEDVQWSRVSLRGADGKFPAVDSRTQGLVRDAVDEVATVGLPRWVGTTLVAPLASTAEPAGIIIVAAGTDQPFNDTQRSFLTLIARAVDAALSHSLAHRREIAAVQNVADALQEAMAPATPSTPPWSVRYRPADHQLSIGGDWYDVVTLRPGVSGLVVGDCVGHGLEAAVLMGQLRSAGRALLLAHLGPAQMLTSLDSFAETVTGAAYTSVFCGIVDEAAGTLTYSSGGHPPGLIVGLDGSTRWLDGARGTPLTVHLYPRAEDVTQLAPGDTVILYSDGLVERRDESLRVGLARLERSAVSLVPQHTLDALPDALLDALVPGSAPDDVAIVIYRANPDRRVYRRST